MWPFPNLTRLLLKHSLKGEILLSDFSIALVIGTLITALMFSALFITKAKTMQQSSSG
jgi:hypothetical protein